jgi:hypothetical protein
MRLSQVYAESTALLTTRRACSSHAFCLRLWPHSPYAFCEYTPSPRPHSSYVFYEYTPVESQSFTTTFGYLSRPPTWGLHLRVLSEPPRSVTPPRLECASRTVSQEVHQGLVTAQFFARCPFWLHRKQTFSRNGVRSFACASLEPRGGLARFSLEARLSRETRTTPSSYRRRA